MIRRMFIAAAGLLAAACFACVPLAPPPSGGVVLAPAILPAPRTCDASPFVSKVFTLSSTYAPVAGTYQAPLGVKPVGDPFKSDLAAAYCMAPPAFQQQLLELNGVFITCTDPNNCASSGQDISTSWGYRENAGNQSFLQHTYIGLSAGLWPNGSLMSYSNYEYNIFNDLLMGASLPVTIKATDSTGNDPTTMTVLAALAHELGHIYSWKLGVDDFACGGSYFADISWLHADKASQYHKFGVETPYSNGKGNAPKTNRADKDKVLSDINNGNGQENKDLNNIYSGYWASLFATVAPDEDFIETYKLWVLTSMQTQPLASLSVTIPTYVPVDMITLMNTAGKDLNKKRNWVSNCFKWS